MRNRLKELRKSSGHTQVSVQVQTGIEPPVLVRPTRKITQQKPNASPTEWVAFGKEPQQNERAVT